MAGSEVAVSFNNVKPAIPAFFPLPHQESLPLFFEFHTWPSPSNRTSLCLESAHQKTDCYLISAIKLFICLPRLLSHSRTAWRPLCLLKSTSLRRLHTLPGEKKVMYNLPSGFMKCNNSAHKKTIHLQWLYPFPSLGRSSSPPLWNNNSSEEGSFQL